MKNATVTSPALVYSVNALPDCALNSYADTDNGQQAAGGAA